MSPVCKSRIVGAKQTRLPLIVNLPLISYHLSRVDCNKYISCFEVTTRIKLVIYDTIDTPTDTYGEKYAIL